MVYEYGEFTPNQVADIKHLIQKKIFFLLIVVDPETQGQYKSVNVPAAFDDILRMLAGFNDLLNHPTEVVSISCRLKAALEEYQKGNEYDFKTYRRLILTAGKEVENIKEV